MTTHTNTATRVAYSDRGFFSATLDELTGLADRWHAKTVTPVIALKRREDWRKRMQVKTLMTAISAAAYCKAERERDLKVKRQARYRAAKRQARIAATA